MNLKKKNDAYHHKHSISNSNARSMNNFLNTEPLSMPQKQGNNTNSSVDNQQMMHSGITATSDMKQYEDRKKVVAAIYLNTMSTKISNVDARER